MLTIVLLLVNLGAVAVVLIVQGVCIHRLNKHRHAHRDMLNQIREHISETIVNEIRRQDDKITKRLERQTPDKAVDNGQGLTGHQTDFKMLPGRSYRRRQE